MLEVTPQKRNRITLSDYDFKKDIENRLAMAQFTMTDLLVLEELLYNSVQIPVQQLTEALSLSEQEILPSLLRFEQMGLLTLKNGVLSIDKEMRKYYESQISKFDPAFSPGMEFLQSLLRKVPIHHLLAWYAIPRTADLIFESLVEKYFLSPQIYERALEELSFLEGPYTAIVQDLFRSAELKLSAHTVMERYHLSREELEEVMLLLEFHFACCLGYEREDDAWHEVILPFHEWKEYLQFIRRTEPAPLPPEEKVQLRDESPFAFVAQLTHLLWRFCHGERPELSEGDQRLAHRLEGLRCLSRENGSWTATSQASWWLNLTPQEQALTLYRSPQAWLLADASHGTASERMVRESEKIVLRALHGEWVFVDDLLRSATVCLGEHSTIALIRSGRQWKYRQPSYSEDEARLLSSVLTGWLWELGAVELGTWRETPCVRVTSFGKNLFAS